MIKFKPIDYFPKRPETKSCGDCTACCEGWLHADVQIGDTLYKVRPGNQCPKIQDHKCTIHDSNLRPLTPCRDYTCMWLTTKDMPDWMRPDKAGVILTQKSIDNCAYMQMVETGKKVDSSILAQVVQYAALNNINIEYTVDGLTYHFGSPEFMSIVKASRIREQSTQ